ncbi:class I SAM-dependent methyltransferase [Lachnospiraceae bacterium ZAX-1]
MSITEYISAQFQKPTGLGGMMSTFLMNTINRRQYSEVWKELSLKNGERVLDVGFGNGFMLQRLARRHKCDYFGIEISQDMVAAANKRNAHAVADRWMNLTSGDIVKTDFESGFFDKIYTINTVYFWDDLLVGLTQIHRILKDGGIFINAIYSREWLDKLKYTRTGFAKYALDELTWTGEQCGFTVRILPIAKGKSYCIIYIKQPVAVQED